ncbi:Diaminopimelate epimerase-like protein [Testicularia cyperi]|uniref:Diaminopimelate epimerase-like protein n=1 Tax=Testicularia cyperi TaxID=1882483 RepID=A0A317XJF3_9BASI|nr:Diaminopimelate epimerase-like protein [Testicularia cyperi]
MTQPNMYPFHQVDVFTATPYFGNPVAVVNCMEKGAPIPSQEAMQRFAKWTNLSETTFLLPASTESGADYCLKIFTPTTELPFAGHPTLGSCFSFLQHRRQNTSSASSQGETSTEEKIVQECGVGNVEIKVSHQDGTISFVAPDFIRYGAVDQETLGRVCQVLNIDPSEVLDSSWVHNGPPWIGVMLKNADTVLGIQPKNGDDFKDLIFGIIGAYPDGKNADGESLAYEVRAFSFEDIGEDPVTGSLNAGIAKWLALTGRSPATEYTNSQGTVLGRKGRISVKVDSQNKDANGNDRIWIGGQCQLCISGSVAI